MVVKEKHMVQEIFFVHVILFSRGDKCAEVWTGQEDEKMSEFLQIQ